MSHFIVQRFVGNLENGPRWEDIEPLITSHLQPAVWDADDPGAAFKRAVLDNPDARLTSTSYRVLPWEEGATFSIAVNVEGQAHAHSEDEAHDLDGAQVVGS